jgi:hypothetical protein
MPSSKVGQGEALFPHGIHLDRVGLKPGLAKMGSNKSCGDVFTRKETILSYEDILVQRKI